MVRINGSYKPAHILGYELVIIITTDPITFDANFLPRNIQVDTHQPVSAYGFQASGSYNIAVAGKSSSFLMKYHQNWGGFSMET